MAIKVNETSTDEALNYIRDRVTRQVICSAEPSDYANVSSVTLGDVSMSDTDLTIQSGGGGRQYSVAQKANVDIDTTGTANHIALVNDTNDELLDVTTVPSTGVSDGGTATINSWTRTIQDPS